ncbi:hypothetical protein ACT6QH_10530 [Xanthobacter sp. TB0139]|uniref:hypothetical protein n=1 Tax=Xanthobacter sp. TB0139 TaxID=3459178 RepID=UPI00403A2004
MMRTPPQMHRAAVGNQHGVEGHMGEAMRFVARFIGFWLLVGACSALIVDGTRTIAASGLRLTSAGDALYALAPHMLEQAEMMVLIRWPELWNWVMLPLLSLPAFLLPGVLGLLLLALGQRPAHRPFRI